MRFCCLCALELCDEAGIALAPLQFGVCAAGGVECIGHVLHAGAKGHPDHYCCNRCEEHLRAMHWSAVLQAVAERYPQLFAFVN